LVPDPYARKWLTLLVVSVGTFMATLDSSIVNISLPSITQALNTDLPTVQWVVTAYLLTITSLLLSFGRLGDILGRKPVYTAGFVVFTAASVICGLAQTIEQLILLRALQGVGAGMMMAISPAIVSAAFPSKERGKALGLHATAVATGASLGPTLGGMLIHFMDWRMVFFARVPVGIIGIALAVLVLRERAEGSRKQRFDLTGAALLSVALSSLLLGMNRGQTEGWDSPATVLLLALFALLSAAFLAVEYRVVQPMLDLSLFRYRVFAASNLSAMLSFMASSGTIFLMPFFLISVQGFDPTQAGALMTVSPLTIAVVGPVSGWLSDRVGSRGLSSLGIAVSCLGLVLLSDLRPGAAPFDVAWRLAMTGLGQGLFQPPNNSCIMSSVPRDRLGIAGGMLATMRNLGMSLGVAIAGAVYSTRYSHALAGNATPGLNQESILTASMVGFHDAYLVAAAFAAIGIFASLVRGQDRPKR